ncbi:MAG: LytR C-terminal domain-containing protein [Candidatus Kapaibacterium sp.]|nr:LytR C-terminal domain-containing protein [Ignavibacteriota bacterium]MCB9220716.1 LytR C-terminal domain-containing protein [Ignavibacteria bacterium]
MKNIILKTSIIVFSITTFFMLLSFILRLNSTPMDTKISEVTEKTGFNNKIQLNVLNASGEKGIASKARNYLRDLGFDVVEIGNFDTMIDSTIVLDRVGDRISSYKLTKAVGIDESRILTAIDSSLYLRATLVLGKDFSKLRFKL